MDDLISARLQMAISLGFHIIFAVMGIGMPLLMALAQWRWLRTGDELAKQLARRWAKGTAIFFAVGAVSGTVLSFELGLLWPRFMKEAGGIIGFPFAMEGFAFFTEAIFLGIYLYAWEKVRPWMHWAAGVIVALSGMASAVFVITVNAWMNAPAGFDYDPATKIFSNIDPIAAMFNPAWKPLVVHMIVASYLATAFGAAGIHAWQLLRNSKSEFDRRALSVILPLAAIAALVQPLTGDWAATSAAVNQPPKFAAMEGQFETQAGAPLRVGGFPDEESRITRYALEIPGMLSFLAFRSFSAPVRGLNEFPREDWPPVAMTHFGFQIMTACGSVMMLAAVWYLLIAWKKRPLALERGLLWLLVLCAPLGFIAIEAGWVVTEVGRQPWIIYRIMRTSEAVTPMPGLVVPMITFTVVYLGLGAIVAALIAHQVRQSSSQTRSADAD